MIDGIPRMRVFAGPNGSGKSTVKNRLNKSAEWFGVYVNADEIEADIARSGELELSRFQLSCETGSLQRFLKTANILTSDSDREQLQTVRIENNRVIIPHDVQSPYLAAALSEYVRELCLSSGKSFTFETVMSHESKLDVLRQARLLGYRRYLYYVATDDPAINVERAHTDTQPAAIMFRPTRSSRGIIAHCRSSPKRSGSPSGRFSSIPAARNRCTSAPPRTAEISN